MEVAYEWLFPKKAEYQQLREFAFFSQQNYSHSLQKIKGKKRRYGQSSQIYNLSVWIKISHNFYSRRLKKKFTQTPKYKIDPPLAIRIKFSMTFSTVNMQLAVGYSLNMFHRLLTGSEQQVQQIFFIEYILYAKTP